MAKANASKKASKSNDDDDLLAPKAKGAAKKGGKTEKKPAKEAASKGNGKAKPKKSSRADDVVPTDDVRAALLKVKKSTSYADFAEATGFNIRQIRRTARALRDDGQISLEKEGTVVYIGKA